MSTQNFTRNSMSVQAIKLFFSADWELCAFTCCESEGLRDERRYQEIKQECLSLTALTKDELAREAKHTSIFKFIIDVPVDRVVRQSGFIA